MIWWHVCPLGALGADTTGADRSCRRPLTDLVGWLDHAVDLGASGLALGPIFSSGSHGYDTLDHYAIDERLGTLDDFHTLVEECHRRGLRIMLDGVFNHVAATHPLVADPEDALRRSAVLPGAEGRRLAVFEGHDQLVTLNHDNPEVADLVVDVMDHWLDQGADAWRLDAAYAVPDRFWRSVLPRVRIAHPDAYVLGEVIHGDYAARVRASGMDTLTQYELWKAIWSSIADANMHELAWALQRHNESLATFTPWTFVGNHDVTRIATRLAGKPAHLALVLLATLPGTPAIYYGDELGWEGLKEDRVGGDDQIRLELPARPPEQLPPVYQFHKQLLGLRRRHPSLTDTAVVVEHVSQGVLAYSAGGMDGVTVVLNAGTDRTSVSLPTGPVLANYLAGADGERAHLQPGGWVITGPAC